MNTRNLPNPAGAAPHTCHVACPFYLADLRLYFLDHQRLLLHRQSPFWNRHQLCPRCVQASSGSFPRGAHSRSSRTRPATSFPHVQGRGERYRIRTLGQLLATVPVPGKLSNPFCAVGFLRRMGYFKNVSSSSRVLTNCFEALSIALASAECEKRGLGAPDAWVCGT